MGLRQRNGIHRLRARPHLSLCVVVVRTVLMDQATGRIAQCHHHNTQQHPVLERIANTPEVKDQVLRVNRVVNNMTSDPNRGLVAAKAGVKSDQVAKETMTSGLTSEAVGTGRAKGVNQAKSKNEGNDERREAVKGRAAGDTANEKANAPVAKEEENDQTASHVNLERANLIAAPAMTVGRRDQGEKSAIDAVKAVVEAQETTDESEFVTLRTSRMAIRSADEDRHTPVQHHLYIQDIISTSTFITSTSKNIIPLSVALGRSTALQGVLASRYPKHSDGLYYIRLHQLDTVKLVHAARFCQGRLVHELYLY